MPFFSGEKMTGGYGGADIISSCTIKVNRDRDLSFVGFACNFVFAHRSFPHARCGAYSSAG